MTSLHALIFNEVCFTYPGTSEPVIDGLTLHLSKGWTGISGPNGCGKSTLLKLATGHLSPDRGNIDTNGVTHYCTQRTEYPPPELEEFMTTGDTAAHYLRGILHIGASWWRRWGTLSHGERKRLQIAVALWMEPAILALDEPTNHLDRTTRMLVARALGGYRGVGLLVSHQRELMDSLTHSTLLFEAGAVQLYHGSIDAAITQATAALTRLSREKQRLISEGSRLQKEARRQQQQESRTSRRRSKKRVAMRDHDTKARIGLARLSGKDGTTGRKAAAMSARAAAVNKRAAEIFIPRHDDGGIALEATRLKRATLMLLEPGHLTLSSRFTLRWDRLHMAPDSRIALTGDNGAGKSTLLSLVRERLTVDPEQLLWLPQEMESAEGRALLHRCRALDRAALGRVMILVRRLGSDPDRLFETLDPSPGEVRKLAIALGMLQKPALLILDEPTNHMDLHSTRCLEAALREYQGALLAVSHDPHFLAAVTHEEWHISRCSWGFHALCRPRRLSEMPAT